MWIYGSGFPKSMNIELAIDKTDTKDFRKQIGKTIKQARIKKNMTMDELCQKLELNNEGHGGMVNHYENGRATPTIELWNKICEILDIRNIVDYEENKKGRYKIVGEIKNPITWFGNGLKKEATTKSAKQWQGWGTALKPSFEPIIVARKPFKGSLVDNVIEYGVGGINIDECRVGNEIITQLQKDMSVYHSNNLGAGSHTKMTGIKTTTEGRFPANTILTYDETDFDEVCGGFPNTKSKGSNANYKKSNQDNTTHLYTNIKSGIHFEDSGSASRYFYCAKASKKDRDEGLENFIEQKVNDGRQTPIDNAFHLVETQRKNIHPTVKPTELMQYLVRLVTPKGGTILDPFMGSGSTGKAVMFENKERNAEYKFIGIEKEKEYYEIANARIKWAEEYKEETLDSMQININEILEEK